MYTTLISASDLQALLQKENPPFLFDCSFDLTDARAGADQFQQGHLPGAVHADLDLNLSDKQHPDGLLAGRHPLPEKATFAAWLGAAGLNEGQQVVVYDRQGANYCGRLWWMLKWCGVEAVAVLDGGLQAWQAAGFALETGAVQAAHPAATAPLVMRGSLVPTVDTATLLGRLGDTGLTVIDARATPRFRGEIEPLDPVAGHIPGALNRPFAANMAPDGKFKSAAQLRQEFETLLAGRDPSSVVHHCGSGVSALPNLLAMAVAGMGLTALYPGSWSAWCNTPGTPRARS
ncbi:3-mercaptopyruvate sulfurtransferase [Hydrogenophaga crassostreae]|uniref:Sulfurtransferase n=1 Tax=Hydrogenophaga crassostreae TaxID=1763535 RepID=A0A162W6U9_9BURK|nr:sulfurtransferase [Hydrogenophaga crassostreae]AOW13850.1 sulfurtransferase [Hydrogenophaga crassostreae]OAD44346.1 3-mercaptopyruvate sulfurtransferase [Hydrogenophaga crassostreae]